MSEIKLKIRHAKRENAISIGPNCRIVATTHSPQLKALSVNDRRFESASVRMKVGSILG